MHLLLAELQAADKLDWSKAMIDKTYRRPLTTTEGRSTGSRGMRARRHPPCLPAG